MSISEKVEYFQQKLYASPDHQQEVAAAIEFLKLINGYPLSEVVRYFTTRIDDLVLKLKQVTIQSKPPGQQARIENPQVWTTVAWGLIEHKLPQIGREMFSCMYEFQLSQQLEMRRRFYKGVSLQNLAWSSFLLGERKLAHRSARLALIEEVINTLEMEEGQQLRIVCANPAYQMLQQSFRESSITLDTLLRFARSYVKTHPDRSLFPEDCHTAYIRAVSTGQVCPAIGEGEHMRWFNYHYFSTLMDLAGRSTSAEASDAALADIACYLFSNVEGLEICDNYPMTGEGFCMMLRNTGREAPLKDFGEFVAVDWRHWNKHLKSSELLELAAKLKLNGLRTVIVFARDGYPEHSNSDPQQIKRTLSQIQSREGVKILVISHHNLICIERRQTHTLSLLRMKNEALCFGEIAYKTETPIEIPAVSSKNTLQIHRQPEQKGRVIEKPRPAISVTTPPPELSTPKPPRLVIKNLPEGQRTSNASRPHEVVLRPCTVCQNPTSLMCLKCGRPHCNVHLQMSMQQCASCNNPPDIDLKLE